MSFFILGWISFISSLPVIFNTTSIQILENICEIIYRSDCCKDSLFKIIECNEYVYHIISKLRQICNSFLLMFTFTHYHIHLLFTMRLKIVFRFKKSSNEKIDCFCHEQKQSKHLKSSENYFENKVFPFFTYVMFFTICFDRKTKSFLNKSVKGEWVYNIFNLLFNRPRNVLERHRS